MVEVTVANVAGVIAAGFFIANQLSPNGLAFILSRLLGDRNSASTWTVASAALQKSHWPTLLRTDQTYNRYSRRSIFWLARLITLMSIILAIAAIVTPLGLYSVYVAGDARPGRLVYVKDMSPFGYGTPPRSNLSWARICGESGIFYPQRPCPFSSSISVSTTYPNGSLSFDYPYGYSLEVPERVLQTYSSGTSGESTISNYFDIQWRRYSTIQNSDYANDTVYLVGAARAIQSVVQDNNRKAVEGLVVDSTIGQIGFRNHTMPQGLSHGAHWQEDLLFVQPETTCVDTNLTLDYTITNNDDGTIEGVFLTDRGGFVNLDPHYPEYDSYNDTQKDPALYKRAYKAAWLLSAYTALELNVTNPRNGSTPSFSYMNSEIGKQFRFASSGYGSSAVSGLDLLSITSDFGDWVRPAYVEGSAYNPWGIGNDNYTTIGLLCSGAGNGDFANITNILVACGQMRGVPQRTDGGSPLVFEKGSQWSQRIFACATAVKASVKTVSFAYNSSEASLASLAIDDIEDKEYPNDEDLPIWGVENTGNAYNSGDINLVWGLVDKSYKTDVNVSTIQSSRLYLPGWLDYTLSMVGMAYGNHRNMPGSDFSIAALSSAYGVELGGLSSGQSVISQSVGTDYTGSSQLSMWTRWQNLTANAESAAIIPNLIFTDVATSLVVGTKGALGPDDSGTQKAQIMIHPMIQTVRYHLAYGIPAFIAAVLIMLIVVGAVLSIVFPFDGFGGYHRLKHHVQGLAPGRIYTMMSYPGTINSQTNAKEWSTKFGDTIISLSHDHAIAQPESTAYPPEKMPLETSHLRQGPHDE